MIDWGIANPASANDLVGQAAGLLANYNPVARGLEAQQARATIAGTQATTQQTQAQTGQIQAQIQNLGAQTAGQIIQNKANQFQLQSNKFSLASNLFSAVAINPSQESYDSAMTQAAKLGIDTSDAPPMWGAAAQAYVQNKSILTGQALKYYQAQYGMMVQRATMINQINQSNASTLGANARAASAGVGTQLPLTNPNQLPMPSSQGMIGDSTAQPTQSLPDSDNISVGGTTPQQQPMQTGTNGVVGQPGVPGLTNPAAIEQQKQQVDSLNNFQAQTAATDKNYMLNKSLWGQASNIIEGLPDSKLFGTNPITGAYYSRTQSGEALDSITAQLKVNAFNQAVPQTFKRFMPSIYEDIGTTMPDAYSFKSTDQGKIVQGQFLNEATHAYALASPALQQSGVNSMPQQVNQINAALQATGALDTKSFKLDPLKLMTWPQFAPASVQRALQNQGNDGSWTMNATPADIDAARKRGVPDAMIMKGIAQVNGQGQ